MKFPIVIEKSLTKEQFDVWNNVFLPTRGTKNDKTIERSLWRRTQTESNKLHSGWQSDNDKRRKILYYEHKYNIKNNKLIVEKTYLYFSITMPDPEFSDYQNMITENLNKNWVNKNGYYQFGDMKARLEVYKNANIRESEKTIFPDNYKTLSLKIYSGRLNDKQRQKMIWHISNVGIRKSLKRGNPKYINEENFDQLKNYFPAQLMLGCGPSAESGVWPLHTLHDTYSINEPFTKKFIINARDDKFIQSLTSNPFSAINKLSEFYYGILNAQPTSFYKHLQKNYQNNKLVGPIITNNFDGIHMRFGIPEIFVRTYDEVEVLPELQFHPLAKSLLVVGCHADRRGIERRARERGLNILYIDPEGWYVDGEFISYPLESPQDQDFIIKTGAKDAFEKLEKVLNS